MKNPVTAAWNLGVSRDDVEKLIRGFHPTAMEDRWMCRADEPDARGSFAVHLHRSWTGDELIHMHVVLAVLGGGGTAAFTDDRYATIIDITWDKDDGSFLGNEEKAKTLATAVCQGVLGCNF